MVFPRSLITAPTEEPVSLLQMQEELKFPPEDDNALISAKITGARTHIENLTSRALVTQTWDIYPPRFCGDRFELPLGKLQSITYIKYTDINGIQTTISADDYHVDTISEPGQIVLAYGKSWPSATLKTSLPIVIRGVWGYGAPIDVPQPLKDAILLLAVHRYSHPEPIVISDRSGAREIEMPHGVLALIAPYQLWH